MAKNILKEAIADAKAVREVALANAKAALEEAFTPRLQSMLSAKLSEDLNEEEDLDETYMEDEKEDVKEMYDEDEKDGMDETYMEDEKEDLDEEIDLEEILSELELDEAKDEDKDMKEGKDEADEDMKEGKMKDADKDMKEGKDEADEDMKEGKKKEDLDEMEVNYKAETANRAGYAADYVHEGNENFDLDALLEEINNLDEMEDDDRNIRIRPRAEEGKSKYNDPHSSDDMIDYFKNNSEGLNRSGNTGGPKYNDPHSSDADIDFFKQYSEGEGQTNEVLGVAAGVAGLVAAAGGLSAIEMAAEDPEFRAKYPKVAKALAMMQSMGKAAGDAKRMEETAKDKELEETQAALTAVTTELNEVNLLNSKLLYVNRIFKANNLNEGQKLRVVETLDNATNVKEAKLIYETIKDTFTVAKSTKTTPQRSIREGLGMASKAAGGSTARKKPVLNESNDMVARMQKLANIKINQ